VTIAELAQLIADVVGFKGSFRFDRSKPDGAPRKLLDVSKLAELGWRPRVDLAAGIRQTYDWYRASFEMQTA
jgi:GDP-L-fucose synthase